MTRCKFERTASKPRLKFDPVRALQISPYRCIDLRDYLMYHHSHHLTDRVAFSTPRVFVAQTPFPPPPQIAFNSPISIMCPIRILEVSSHWARAKKHEDRFLPDSTQPIKLLMKNFSRMLITPPKEVSCSTFRQSQAMSDGGFCFSALRSTSINGLRSLFHAKPAAGQAKR